MGGPGDERGEPWEERLLAELRSLAQAADPMPDEVGFAAQGSLAWRRIDADLADLTFDSLLADAAAAGVRGSDAVRLVTFEAGDLTVEVEITEAGTGRRMVGQLVPPQPARVEVRSQSGMTDVDADELGRFTAEGLAVGRASLRCHLVEPARVVETGWVVL